MNRKDDQIICFLAIFLLVILVVMIIDSYFPKSFYKVKNYNYDISVCKGYVDCFIGSVDYIVDGDTLTVGGVKIRLALTNTPERGEDGFEEAKEFTESLCPLGSSVLVDEDDGQTIGSEGRILAVVYCGNYNLNEELLELGHGWILTYFCERSEFSNEDWAVKFGC